MGGLRLWSGGDGGGWPGGRGGASARGADWVGSGSRGGKGARVAGCICVVFLAFPGVASLTSSKVLERARFGELVGPLRRGLGGGARGGPSGKRAAELGDGDSGVLWFVRLGGLV